MGGGGVKPYLENCTEIFPFFNYDASPWVGLSNAKDLTPINPYLPTLNPFFEREGSKILFQSLSLSKGNIFDLSLVLCLYSEFIVLL